MRQEMVMPQMGESIAEATILKWHKGVGDQVEKDQTILEISTDKVDSEIPSPASGTIVEIIAQEGDTVEVKSVIAVIETDASAAASATNGQASAEPQTKVAPAAPVSPAAPVEPAPAQNGSSSVPPRSGEKVFSPLVRSMAAQYGLSAAELSNIPGSGSNGRVTKDDLVAYMQSRSSAQPAASVQPAAQSIQTRPAPAPTPAPVKPAMNYDESGVKVVKMDKMRQMIAEHMVRSKATSPHVYSTAEVDVTNIGKWRKAKQAEFVEREGFKLSFTPFFLEAATKGLIHYPYINASVDGDNIIVKKNVNLGCAVALGETGTDGLIVPVIKNADLLSLTGIARSLNDLASRARKKKLSPDEVQGGTFTVTNPGIFGNIIGNPIINQPQVAILSLGAIKKRPVVINDSIAIRDIIYLTLSYDHRIVDGALAGQFLAFMTKYLESWDLKKELF